MRIFFGVLLIALAAPVFWPPMDVWASGLFYRPEAGFFLADQPALVGLHNLAYGGARVLGIFCLCLALAAFWLKRPLAGIDAKGWAFLLIALIIGPGLIANVGLKDHWGRARPREITEFGGSQSFTPALQPHFERARSNGSFVAGDAAFGFFLPALALVAPLRLARRCFWISMGVAGLFSFARLAMGAHFLSDILYAAAAMLITVSILHALLYRRDQTMRRWTSFFTSAAA